MDFTGHPVSGGNGGDLNLDPLEVKGLCIKDEYCLPSTAGEPGQIIVAQLPDGSATAWEDPEEAGLTGSLIYLGISGWPISGTVAAEETMLPATSVASPTIKANTMQIGDDYEFNIRGRYYAANAGGSADLAFKIGPVGSVVIQCPVNQTQVAAGLEMAWKAIVHVTIVGSPNAAGPGFLRITGEWRINTYQFFSASTTTVLSGYPFQEPEDLIVDPTIDNDIDFTITSNVAGNAQFVTDGVFITKKTYGSQIQGIDQNLNTYNDVTFQSAEISTYLNVNGDIHLNREAEDVSNIYFDKAGVQDWALNNDTSSALSFMDTDDNPTLRLINGAGPTLPGEVQADGDLLVRGNIRGNNNISLTKNADTDINSLLFTRDSEPQPDWGWTHNNGVQDLIMRDSQLNEVMHFTQSAVVGTPSGIEMSGPVLCNDSFFLKSTGASNVLSFNLNNNRQYALTNNVTQNKLKIGNAGNTAMMTFEQSGDIQIGESPNQYVLPAAIGVVAGPRVLVDPGNGILEWQTYTQTPTALPIKFSSTVTKTITNTASQQSCTTGVGGVGNLVIEPNSLAVGDVISIRIAGMVQNNGGGTKELDFRFSVGGTSEIQVYSLAFQGIQTGASKRAFVYQIVSTVRSIGAATQLESMWSIFTEDNNSFEGNGNEWSSFNPFNSTVSNTIEVTAQWDVASTGHILDVNQVIITKNPSF